MSTALIDTGSANSRSIATALRRIGLDPRRASGPREVSRADLVVLPGVGSFGAAASRLEQQDLCGVLRERVEANRPVLAICVGLQLLARDSEESPGAHGLGILDARVCRFPSDVRVPHMGWNRVSSDWCEPGYASFANSYRLGAETLPAIEAAGWQVAITEHGEPFVAALRRGPILGCQFHPELSGPWGLRLLRTWAERGLEEVAAC